MPHVFNHNLFHPRTLAKFYELIPLVSFVGGACAVAVGYCGFSLYQKPDVWVMNKSAKIPPWEKVNREGPTNAKEYAFRKYHMTNADVEKLRQEIGSYKTQ